MKLAVGLVYHDHAATVLGQSGTGVVAALESHPLRVATGHVIAIDLRPAAAVGGEINRTAIGGPGGLGVDGIVPGNTGQCLARQVHDVDVRAAILGQHHGHAPAVRGPGGRAVQPLEIGQLLPRAGSQFLAEDCRAAGFEGHVGNVLGIRRPARRQQRLPGLQQHHRPGAIGVGHGQAIDTLLPRHPLHRHVQQASGEGPAHPCQGLVDFVGDPV